MNGPVIGFADVAYRALDWQGPILIGALVFGVLAVVFAYTLYAQRPDPKKALRWKWWK
jgi:hypothetical protein